MDSDDVTPQTSVDHSSLGILGRTSIAFLILLCVSLTLSLWMSKHEPLVCPECNCGEATSEASLIEKSHEIAEQRLGMGLALVVGALMLCALGAYFAAMSNFVALPNCLLYIFLGIILGAALRIGGGSAVAAYALPNPEQFFLFILPPIIFEAAYSMDKEQFLKEIVGILVYAVVGTTLAAGIFAAGMYSVGILGVSQAFTGWEALAFGALITSVDPVATIAVFNAVKVNKTLHFLVFGESVLNDVVCIVLYHLFAHMAVITNTKQSIYQPIFALLNNSIGSSLIGVASSFVCSLTLKNLDLNLYPTLELSLFILFSYFPYFIAEGFGCSGIVALFVSGLLLSLYARWNLSLLARKTSAMMFELTGFLAEAFVFIYVGIAFATFKQNYDPMTVIWALTFTLLSRAMSVFPLSALLNVYRKDKIPFKNQFIIWFSGLRGSICFVLSLNFPGFSEEKRRLVISTTLAVVLFTMIFLGGGTLPLLRLLKVESADAAQNLKTGDGDELFVTNMRSLRSLDERYFRPLLVAPERMSEMEEYNEF